MKGAFPNLVKEDFDTFIDDEWEDHLHYNGALLKAFRPDPLHLEPRKTRVKMFLLDKAYSAGLRRWVSDDYKKNEQSVAGFYIDKIYDGRRVHRFRDIMKEASELKGRLSNKNIGHVIDLHGRFSAYLYPLLRKTNNGNDVNFNSFCAKYLWFHAGAFPVYDRLAKTGLKKLRGRGPEQYASYEAFARDVYALLKELHPGRRSFSREEVKQADGFLLWIADRRTGGTA